MFGSIYEVPYLHIDDEEKLKKDSIQVMKSETIRGSFISSDSKSVSLFIKHEDHLEIDSSRILLADINDKIDDFNFDKTYLGGRVVGHVFFTDLTRSELVLFIGASVFLLVLFPLAYL